MFASELNSIRELLGDPLVLVPIPFRSKGPRLKGWRDLTADSWNDPTLRSRLLNHGNVGVLLGKPSGGLCSVDIDDDADLERFLECNPFLANTLQTRGRRGGNLWVRAGDSAPPLTHYVRNGKPWGEWRSDGGLTVIAGYHPSGKAYQFIHRVPPVKVDFSDLLWPPGVSPTRPSGAKTATFGEAGASVCRPSSASSESLYDSENSASSTSSTSLHDNDEDNTITYSIEAARAKQEFTRHYAHLEPYYERWIGRIHQAKPGTRNQTLVTFLTFLAHCVSHDIALLLALQFYDRNRAMWKDSREQHLYEASNHLGNVLASYPETLKAAEAELYAFLSERTQTTFRIGRDLASETAEKEGEPRFFLSCQDLGHRTGLDSRQADRILKELESLRVIEVLKKGSARRRGQRCMATSYRWLLSLKARN